ncbi:MAG TPA: PH domain-containing protein [Allosphingosinicella sp.]|nr:PH domain-containing protein [Allosphingosinicella sp.]
MSEGAADRRLHPGTIALRFIKEAPSTLVALPAALAFTSKAGLTGALFLAAALAAALLFFKWLAWRRFRYGVGAAEIVIESGILNRNRRSIPFGRIQDVDIERTFLARLFGLAKVRIETGAGGKDEGLLDSVSIGEARRLRETVRARGAGTAPAPEVADEQTEEPGDVLFEMDLPRLLLFGLFSFSLVYIAGLFAFLQTFDRFLPFDVYDPARWVGLADEYLPHRWTPGAIGAVLLLATLIGFVAGIARTVSRDFGFRLSLEGDRFRRERGLFTRSEAVIARRRVQLAEIQSGPLRALFGWSALSFQTLGAGTDRGGHPSAAPFATRAEIERVLEEVPPLRPPPPPELAPVSQRHILRSSAARLAPAIAAIVALSAWQRPALWLLGLLPLLAVAAALERRFHRYALAGDLLLVSRGVWRRRLWLVPLASVQCWSLSRGPLQRRLGLATLSIDTAGASMLNAPRIVDLRAGDAAALAAELSRARSRHSGRKSGTER